MCCLARVYVSSYKHDPVWTTDSKKSHDYIWPIFYCSYFMHKSFDNSFQTTKDKQ